ncbi:hypothetical protein PR048_022342 [Dryococelus australis]|uniref:Uncharacterized protein n=1 Tax=Dryococelus australis TaxID=614101 RepID=A0ABQ9H114_9NEOP|nr:hypothetical protein PR048_022342 [Dryococelus australis]
MVVADLGLACHGGLAEPATPTNPSEDPAVRKLQAFFSHSEQVRQEMSVRLVLDGLQLYLFSDMDEHVWWCAVQILSSPVRDMNHGLCKLDVGEATMSLEVFSDHSLEAKMMLQCCLLEDIRTDNSILIRRFSPGSPPDIRTWESCRTMPLVGEFSGDFMFPPPVHSGFAPYSPRFTLAGSQDLDVESRPDFFTHLTISRLQYFKFTSTRGLHISFIATAHMAVWRGFGRRILQSHGGERRDDGSAISVSTPPIVDATFRQSGAGDRCVDVLVERTRLNLSVPFFLHVCRFLLDSLPGERPAEGGVVNHGYVGDLGIQAEVTVAIGSEFITHTLNDSAPIADLQECKKRIPYCRIWGTAFSSANPATWKCVVQSRLNDQGPVRRSTILLQHDVRLQISDLLKCKLFQHVQVNSRGY